MIREKNTYKTRGIDKYQFYFDKEKQIYCCLYCLYKHKKYRKKLNKEQLFETPSEWKEHVISSNREKDKNKLMDFSKYLEMVLRQKEELENTWKIFMKVFLAGTIGVCLKEIIVYLAEIYEIIEASDNLLFIIGSNIGITLILTVIILPIINIVFEPTDNSFAEKSFVKDYLTVINEMIAEQEKMEKKQKKITKEAAPYKIKQKMWHRCLMGIRGLVSYLQK